MERITSRKNPLAVHMKKLGTSRSYRDETGEFLCDGIKLLEDAVRSETVVTNILTSSGIPFPLSLDTHVYYAQRSLIDSLSPLKNSQDILFTCKIKKDADVAANRYSGGVSLILDNMQDPGNVGTIIRTANAFGVQTVILYGGCADPYNPKTIRASMGSIFRQNIIYKEIQDLQKIKEEGVRFIGASLSGADSDIRSIGQSGIIIAIGSEGQGLSEQILSLCDEIMSIPIAKECESLNAAAAAAIFIWESRKCRM